MASENGCPIEIHHIEIEQCDEMYDENCSSNKNLSMPFYRANYDRRTGQSPNTPREQVNCYHMLHNDKHSKDSILNGFYFKFRSYVIGPTQLTYFIHCPYFLGKPHD